MFERSSFCGKRHAEFQLSASEFVFAHHAFNFALRGDAHLFEEFADGHIERVVVRVSARASARLLIRRSAQPLNSDAKCNSPS
jgi:hypothetical protein